MTDQKLNGKESATAHPDLERPSKPEAKCAIFTLTIQNDDFDCMDLMTYSRIMEGMTKVIGPKARIVSHTMDAMVFEEDTPRSWRDLPTGDTHQISACPTVDGIELLEDDEVLEEVEFKMKDAFPSNSDVSLFFGWSRESLEILLGLIEKESKTK